MERQRQEVQSRQSGNHQAGRCWRSLYLTSCACMFLLTVPLSLRAQTASVVEGTLTDQQGLAVAGAEVHISNSALGTDRSTLSGQDGTYKIQGLSAGTYTLSASKAGFVVQTFRNLELTVNCTFALNIELKVEGRADIVEVSAVTPLLESGKSSTGSTILPQQIEQMPLNGRNYLDLLQLVPGVAINRQQDPSLDSATPILGERGGNTVFLVDGMPNRDEINGGAAAQFNQDSILAD